MLGRGGMAVVYLATEIGLSRKVALKVLPPELTFGHGVERFKREARTAAALDHPHIIPIYRIGDSGKLFWYAMKYLEGKSLEDTLKEKGSLSIDETVEILEQVADALDYAHDHKVIHRDIKPANVMLDNRERVIVTDFGIAKALSEGKLTATDSVIGTPYFMSPEQGMGKTVSGASDQYSVAVMAYRMLAGHVPFDGDSAIDILHKHCMFPAPLLADDVPGIPPHVAEAVARALSKSGDDRFVNVSEFVKAIKDPHFKAKGAARPSVATVVMDPAEAKKLRTANAGAKGGSNAGKAKASGAEDRTVVAGARAAARPAPAPAPAPKSKMGLYAAVAVVLIGGGGFAAMKMMGGANPPATQAQTPANNPASDPATNPATNPSGTGAQPTGAIPPSDPPAAAAAETKTPETKTAPPPVTKAPTRPVTQAKKGTTTPTNTPVNTPVQQAPAPNPEPAAPSAATTGKLNLLLTPPGIVEIDGRDYGERSRFSTDLSEGTHVVRVRKDGFTTITQTVEIKVGTPTVLRLTLEPKP